MTSRLPARFVTLCVFAVCLLNLPGPAISGEKKKNDDAGARQAAPRDKKQAFKVDPKKIDAAVDKGVEWLRKQQKDDGSWLCDKPGAEQKMVMGYTAFATFALLKGGVRPNDAAVVKAFAFLEEQKLRYTYSVSCYILALEARYAPPPPRPAAEGKKKKKDSSATVPYEEQMKRNWRRKALSKDRKKMRELVEWLLSKQTDTAWRYPGVEPNVDASNTQYALLALNAGRRCGVPIGRNVWLKTIKYFLEEQDKDGPEVEPFVVPAADWDISRLKKAQKEFLKRLRTAQKKTRRQGDEVTGRQGPGTRNAGPRTSLDPEEYGLGIEEHTMKARGWSYTPKSAGEGERKSTGTTGAMTTSGVASLVICKAALEGAPEYRKVRKKLNQSIRDGAAWLAHKFSVVQTYHGWNYYYYLYGFERAGVLSCCERFGSHDWYPKGANAILGKQNPDGSWPSDGAKGMGTIAHTCFSILFLKRATTPLIGNPNDRVIWTGKGLTKAGKGKEEEGKRGEGEEGKRGKK